MPQVFSEEQKQKYVQTRLGGSNLDLADVREINLYSGFLPSQLEERLRSDAPGYRRVIQRNGREPIFFSDGRLFISEYSSRGREMRYISMIEAYQELCGRDVRFNRVFPCGRARNKNINYENFAYDFVTGLFVPEKKHEQNRIFHDEDPRHVRKLVIGDLEAVAKHADKVLERGKTEYLDAQMVSIGGEDVLNIGYVYADQAYRIVYKMLVEWVSTAEEKGTMPKIDVYMFGRVGGLKENQKRHDLVLPNGIIDHNHSPMAYDFDNTFSSAKYGNRILNVRTVIDQTTEQLEAARKNGCSCVEMEASGAVGAIKQVKVNWPDNIRVNFGFIGHVSDLPLKGDTLADELDSDLGQRDAANMIAERIAAGD
jgi:hypothetical protein